MCSATEETRLLLDRGDARTCKGMRRGDDGRLNIEELRGIGKTPGIAGCVASSDHLSENVNRCKRSTDGSGPRAPVSYRTNAFVPGSSLQRMSSDLLVLSRWLVTKEIHPRMAGHSVSCAHSSHRETV